MNDPDRTTTANRTWYVRRTRWDGASEAIRSCASEAEATAWVAKLNSERTEDAYYWEAPK